ncbi:hypothetical protein [Mycobacterium sp.]|uniref:hypothetical protein n=1 Tax=Mycobacterium sp. TaxID=1785 RepID=UPI0031E47115
MPVAWCSIEHAFKTEASPQLEAHSADLDDVGFVDAITAEARRQNAMCARELAAIGELYASRAPEDDTDRINWAIDGHDDVVAEVRAALGDQSGSGPGAVAVCDRFA